MLVNKNNREEVYLAGYLCSPDHIKIGHSRKKTSEERVKEWGSETGSPMAPVVLARIYCAEGNAHPVERLIHRSLKNFETVGGGTEWYRVTLDMARKASMEILGDECFSPEYLATEYAKEIHPVAIEVQRGAVNERPGGGVVFNLGERVQPMLDQYVADVNAANAIASLRGQEPMVNAGELMDDAKGAWSKEGYLYES